jgi:hypothetical protein
VQGSCRVEAAARRSSQGPERGQESPRCRASWDEGDERRRRGRGSEAVRPWGVGQESVRNQSGSGPTDRQTVSQSMREPRSQSKRLAADESKREPRARASQSRASQSQSRATKQRRHCSVSQPGKSRSIRARKGIHTLAPPSLPSPAALAHCPLPAAHCPLPTRLTCPFARLARPRWPLAAISRCYSHSGTWLSPGLHLARRPSMPSWAMRPTPPRRPMLAR